MVETTERCISPQSRQDAVSKLQFWLMFFCYTGTLLANVRRNLVGKCVGAATVTLLSNGELEDMLACNHT
jgi:hypothetical protein